MSDYEYDIFVSYRRMDPEWIRWTKDIFAAPLASLLKPDVGGVRIFVDDQIETGATWPDRLASALARSRLLIPLLCCDYLESNWCNLELSLMYQRHKQSAADGRLPLILPLMIGGDLNTFPREIQELQIRNIRTFANPFISRKTKTFFKFTKYLHEWCPSVKNALREVPPFDPAWEATSRQQFNDLFSITCAEQTTMPGLSLMPIPAGESTP